MYVYIYIYIHISCARPVAAKPEAFLPVSLNLVCSRYAAAANEEEKISW